MPLEVLKTIAYGNGVFLPMKTFVKVFGNGRENGRLCPLKMAVIRIDSSPNLTVNWEQKVVKTTFELGVLKLLATN